MNDKNCILELKKIIRRIIKNNKCKSNKNEELNNHIYIIKSILIFISRIILVKTKYDKLDSENILIAIENNTYKDLEKLLTGIEDVKEYMGLSYLDREIKIEVIEIINKVKKEDLIEVSLGELYNSFTTNNEKKLLGQVYTPRDIVKDMVTNSISSRDIIANPWFKAIDPACGGGYFLIEAYDRIKKIIIENYDKIIMCSKEVKQELKEGIHKFILKHNIWGKDIDGFAIYMTRFSLNIKGEIVDTNISTLDSLLDDGTYLKEKSFDLVISNPPYVGHKQIDKKYRLSLSESYSDVYNDKGDISYCFFKKGYELLKDNGKLLFITSRYFLESPSGKGLRKFMNQRFLLNTIIDFYGENVFKGIGISPVILKCTRKNIDQNNITVIADIKVYKRKNNKKTYSFRENLKTNFIEFNISQDSLQDSGWILLSIKEKQLFDKIDKLGDTCLKDLCIFNQGIITGLDKAFIIDDKELNANKYEKNLIKPWIKNSDIGKYHLKDINKHIIYTDIIDNEENYPYVIDRIKEYKNRLEIRRECKSGIRKWYELQWGRNEGLFKNEKIVFPYKASENRFTIVRDEVCSSADVYFITSKDDEENEITLEYLAAFLNSKVCEFYFKCIGKKLNDKLYEYYPNKLETLRIVLNVDIEYIKGLVKEIEDIYIKDDYTKVENPKEKIDEYFYEIYGLNEDEIELIESYN